MTVSAPLSSQLPKNVQGKTAAAKKNLGEGWTKFVQSFAKNG
jgi:hypothetical protein